MKFHLLIFLAAALLQECVPHCPSKLKGKLLCALFYTKQCFVTMEYCSLEEFNCGNSALKKPMFIVLHAGPCTDANLMYRCKSVEF